MRKKQTNKQNPETERKKLKTRESEGGCGKRGKMWSDRSRRKETNTKAARVREILRPEAKGKILHFPKQKLHNKIERNDPRMLKLVVGGHISLSGLGSEAAHFIFLTPCSRGTVYRSTVWLQGNPTFSVVKNTFLKGSATSRVSFYRGSWCHYTLHFLISFLAGG